MWNQEDDSEVWGSQPWCTACELPAPAGPGPSLETGSNFIHFHLILVPSSLVVKPLCPEAGSARRMTTDDNDNDDDDADNEGRARGVAQ